MFAQMLTNPVRRCLCRHFTLSGTLEKQCVGFFQAIVSTKLWGISFRVRNVYGNTFSLKIQIYFI